MDISKMSLRSLKARYGKSNGKDREAGDELQARGLNSKQLGEVLAEYSQERWQKGAKRASKIHTAQRTKARVKKRRQRTNEWWNHIRKRQLPKTTMPSEGTTNNESEVAPSASDGSCPF